MPAEAVTDITSIQIAYREGMGFQFAYELLQGKDGTIDCRLRVGEEVLSSDQISGEGAIGRIARKFLAELADIALEPVSKAADKSPSDQISVKVEGSGVTAIVTIEAPRSELNALLRRTTTARRILTRASSDSPKRYRILQEPGVDQAWLKPNLDQKTPGDKTNQRR